MFKIGAMIIKRGKFEQGARQPVDRDNARLEYEYRRMMGQPARPTGTTNSAGTARAPRPASAARPTDAARRVSAASHTAASHTTASRAAASGRTVRKKKKDNRKKVAIGIIVVFLVLALGAGGFLLIYSRDDGLIFNNVYAMDVNLSGMTQDQAKGAIEQRAMEIYSRDLIIELQDRQLVLPAAKAGVTIDAAAIAQLAHDYGREGNMFDRARARAAADLTSYTIDMTQHMTIDRAYIDGEIDRLGQDIYTALAQPVVSLEGQAPDLSRYVMSSYTSPEENPDLIKIDPAQENLLIEGGLKLSVTTGTAGRELDTQALKDSVYQAYTTGNLSKITTTYTEVQPNPVNAEEIFNQYNTAAVDAAVDTETYLVSRETLGYGFSLEELQAFLTAAQEGQTASLDFSLLLPQITKEGIEGEMFKDVLVEVSTRHTSNADRTTNLRLACAEIDGYIVKPGEVFSFNKIVGERTAKKGYKKATIYAGNDSVEEVGGGICQVASTIYYGALLADYEIVERTAHRFVVTYVPMGCDATIYWGSLDFKFKNNTEYPMKININVANGKVNMTFTGTETKDYYVKMKWDEKEKTDWEEVYVLLTDANREQYAEFDIGDTIVTPYTGYEGKTWKCKYDKETGELISKDVEDESKYAKRDKQILVDVMPTEPPTDPDPDPDAGGDN